MDGDLVVAGVQAWELFGGVGKRHVRGRCLRRRIRCGVKSKSLLRMSVLLVNGVSVSL